MCRKCEIRWCDRFTAKYNKKSDPERVQHFPLQIKEKIKLRFQSTDPNNTRIEDSAKKCAETAKYGGANDLLQNS